MSSNGLRVLVFGLNCEACDNEGHPRHRKDRFAYEDANLRLPAANSSVHRVR
jgi:hypothetical protein